MAAIVVSLPLVLPLVYFMMKRPEQNERRSVGKKPVRRQDCC